LWKWQEGKFGWAIIGVRERRRTEGIWLGIITRESEKYRPAPLTGNFVSDLGQAGLFDTGSTPLKHLLFLGSEKILPVS